MGCIIMDIIEKMRAHTCLDCKVFCPIITESIENTLFLKKFVGQHRHHRLVIIPIEELRPIRTFDPEYKCIAFNDIINKV